MKKKDHFKKAKSSFELENLVRCTLLNFEVAAAAAAAFGIVIDDVDRSHE